MQSTNKSAKNGGKFLSKDGKAAQAKAEKRAQAKEQQARKAKAREKILTTVGMILGDFVLIYMVLNGLIDQIYGVLFVTGVSALMGYNMK